MNKSNTSLLEKIEENAEADAQILLKKNKFILNILNNIGSFVDKGFEKIQEFNIEANLDALRAFHEFFFEKCKNSEEMWSVLDIIFSLIEKYEELDENRENLITELMCIFSGKKLNEQENVSLMEKLMKNNLKLCLKKEEYEFMIGYNQLFTLELSEFLNILYLLISDDNSKNLTKHILRVLKINYKNIIIPNSMINTLNFESGKSFVYLNQLIRLNLEVDEQHILIFENALFKIRKPSTDELFEYINESSKKNASKKKDKNKEKQKKQKDELKIKKDVPENISINIKPLHESSNKQFSDNLNIDINNININNNDPLLKNLLSIIDKLNKKLEKYDNKIKELKAGFESTQTKLESTQTELKSTQTELESTKVELEKLKRSNMNMQVKINNLELDLRKIKIRSVFKGVIDIFSYVFNIDINDYYFNKLGKLLDKLFTFKKNDRIDELCDFLRNTYYYLHKGNILAHSIDETLSPLDTIFQILKSDKNKSYQNIRPILIDLSLNETLKYAMNNYYSFKDQNRILNNIKFSKEFLATKLA